MKNFSISSLAKTTKNVSISSLATNKHVNTILNPKKCVSLIAKKIQTCFIPFHTYSDRPHLLSLSLSTFISLPRTLIPREREKNMVERVERCRGRSATCIVFRVCLI
jgi:hypothetical protein